MKNVAYIVIVCISIVLSASCGSKPQEFPTNELISSLYKEGTFDELAKALEASGMTNNNGPALGNRIDTIFSGSLFGGKLYITVSTTEKDKKIILISGTISKVPKADVDLLIPKFVGKLTREVIPQSGNNTGEQMKIEGQLTELGSGIREEEGSLFFDISKIGDLNPSFDNL